MSLSRKNYLKVEYANVNLILILEMDQKTHHHAQKRSEY